jgi:hypothetical protein
MARQAKLGSGARFAALKNKSLAVGLSDGLVAT